MGFKINLIAHNAIIHNAPAKKPWPARPRPLRQRRRRPRLSPSPRRRPTLLDSPASCSAEAGLPSLAPPSSSPPPPAPSPPFSPTSAAPPPENPSYLPSPPSPSPPGPLSPAADAEPFVVAALGNDAELLTPGFLSDLCSQRGRVRVVVPPEATPAGMVESLGHGAGRRILCPVPLVVCLEEPQVVPEFLAALAAGGWAPVRVPAYETKWAGPGCSAALLQAAEGRGVDAIVFTSTAEVEGLAKGLEGLGSGWGEVRRRWPGMVVAAHGPVTAAGAAAVGVEVDVVGERFGSFEGVVEALGKRLS